MSEETPVGASCQGAADPAEITNRHAMPNTVLLTDTERSVLTGLVAGRDAVIAQIDGYLTNVVSARLGVHRNRIANADISTGLVTLASDAPKAP